MSDLVSVKDVQKKFDSFFAVSGVSFSAKKGDVLGFLGPNGAGKTTTMRMIAGYLHPTAGKIEVCGTDVIDNPIEIQKKIGYLPEGGPLYADMTPASFLRFIGEVRGLSGTYLDERIEYVVKHLNIADVFYQTIDTLSKGYKRRVALAQAIIHDPEVLILDEPTDGLDPNQKHEVRELITSMSKDKAIIISTHILEEVEAICNKAIIIAKGKIVASGTPEQLATKSPNHNAVVIKLKKSPADRVLSDILQVKGVERVTVEGANKVVAFSKDGKDILADVGDAVRKKKVAVETIYNRSGGLNGAFRALTKDVQES